MDKDVRAAIDTIWNYMQLHQSVVPVDAIILLGSRDDRVANYAGSLLENNVAPICVVTGGAVQERNPLASTWPEASEAEHFAAILIREGMQLDRIYIETEAANTGQNALLSHQLLLSHGIQPASILVVTKPYMERRALATFQAQWPERATKLYVSSMGGTIDEYCNQDQLFETVVNVMVGDFQRIIDYPKRGYSTVQEIPEHVRQAGLLLKKVGYIKNIFD